MSDGVARFSNRGGFSNVYIEAHLEMCYYYNNFNLEHLTINDRKLDIRTVWQNSKDTIERIR